jgi:molybdopterin molybdotransferase
VVSPLNVPAHDNSAMDGYAVRFGDLRKDGVVTLRVAGTAYAGTPFGGILGAGECVRIMTGAVMPPGADTIVMQEHVEAKDEKVTIGAGHRKGQHLRRAGED